jgi:hypothetical protein
MLSDEEVLSLYPVISQIVEDILQQRIQAILAAGGLNLGNTDGAGEGELWAAGNMRAGGGLALGETGFAPPNGVVLARQVTSPGTPPTGTRLLYAKADGWYQKGPDGVEAKL